MSLSGDSDQLFDEISNLRKKVTELVKSAEKSNKEYMILYVELCKAQEDNECLRNIVSAQNLLIDALNKRIGSFTNE